MQIDRLEFLWTSKGGPDPLTAAYGVGTEGSAKGEFQFSSTKASVARVDLAAT